MVPPSGVPLVPRNITFRTLFKEDIHEKEEGLENVKKELVTSSFGLQNPN